MRSHKIRIQHGGTPRRKFDEVALNQRCEILGLDFRFYYLLAQRQYVNIGDTSFFSTTQAIFCKAEPACILVEICDSYKRSISILVRPLRNKAHGSIKTLGLLTNTLRPFVEKQEVTSLIEKIHRRKKL
jgi:hypothetical protein